MQDKVVKNFKILCVKEASINDYNTRSSENSMENGSHKLLSNGKSKKYGHYFVLIDFAYTEGYEQEQYVELHEEVNLLDKENQI